MASITQDMRFRPSLLNYAKKHGVSKDSIKYKTNRQYISPWNQRFDAPLSPSESTPGNHFIIPTNIPLRKSS